MKLKLLLFAAAYLMFYSFIFKEHPVDREKVNQSVPVENQFNDFELTLGRKYTPESTIDGETELLKNIKPAQREVYKKWLLDNVYSEFTFVQNLSSKTGLKPVTMKKRNETGSSVAARIYLNDGLEFRLNSTWAFRVQVENPLGWFQPEDGKRSLSPIVGNETQSTVTFTVEYRF